MDIYLNNTLTRKKEAFKPIKDGEVLMYNCGPTVYGRQHIGNLSMFVFTDILRRSLEYFDYNVNQVINITDFGRLASDGVEGEDKMTKGLKNEGLDITMENMKILATKYADIFKNDISELNVIAEEIKFPYASDYIEEQKKLIERLEEKGFVYTIEDDGVYFDTGMLGADYGKLGGLTTDQSDDQSRIGIKYNKKSTRDFALWKFNQNLGWDSKWGKGFPGWHIECTAMIFSLLGEQIDIHTGGIEHIPIHHNNEIAQAETASDKIPFSKFWLHRDHLKIEDSKIAKSTGNTLYLPDLKTKKIHPLAFRYWLLSSHYRTPVNFTWDSIFGAHKTLEKLVFEYDNLPEGEIDENTIKKFESFIADDLDTPRALALLHEAYKEKKTKNTISKIDKVFALNIPHLSKITKENIPQDIIDLKEERDSARASKNFQKSDELRTEIESQGYILEDHDSGSTLRKTLASII